MSKTRRFPDRPGQVASAPAAGPVSAAISGPALRREFAFSFVILLVILFYIHAIFVLTPYSGFSFNALSGVIEEVYVQAGPRAGLKPGDVLLRVGPLTWEEYSTDRTRPFFEAGRPGDVVIILVERAGTPRIIYWRLPGFNSAEFRSRLFNIWGLADIFWLFGFALQLLVRPADIRRRLLIAANYLTALWLIFGCLSATHRLGSSLLLHAVTWILLPVYLHLHWVFPRPLAAAPRGLGVLLYGAGAALAVAELFQALPRNLYALGFLAALGGSVLLQTAHFIARPEQRREVGLLAAAVTLAVAPSILFSLLLSPDSLPAAGPLAFLALPLMPLAYFYVIHRARMGGMELRVNRLISLYAFLILLGTVLFLSAALLSPLSFPLEAWVFTIAAATLFTAFFSITVFPGFQALVERHLFGIRLPLQDLREAYSARISGCTTVSGLVNLLEQELIPSLLVREFAFLQAVGGNLHPLLRMGIGEARLPSAADLDGPAARLSAGDPPHDWIRLVLPLAAGDTHIGFWIFGRRDPDDLYPHAEQQLLRSLADQTAVALSNIQQAGQLRRMYQLDTERREKERLHLALDLHDSILNQLAVLRTSLDERQLTPEFHQAYDEMTRRLREIVSDLRPPMLMYGLKPALGELADNLMQRNGDRIRVTVEVEACEQRLPVNIEQHLFRIAQEAGENALRHAQARNIRISGRLTPGQADLAVADDGIGFDLHSQVDPQSLLAGNHFGLAGIVERAHLIGARLRAHSTPGEGTCIRVEWRAAAE